MGPVTPSLPLEYSFPVSFCARSVPPTSSHVAGRTSGDEFLAVVRERGVGAVSPSWPRRPSDPRSHWRAERGHPGGNVTTYAGAPIIHSPGLRLGAVCVIDTVPREMTAKHTAFLEALALVCVDQLRLRQQDGPAFHVSGVRAIAFYQLPGAPFQK